LPVSTLACSVTEPAAPNASAAIVYHGSTGEIRLELTGAVTYPIDLGMMPAAGLRGLRIVYDALDANGDAATDNITIRRTINSVSRDEPLSPGGWFAFADPAPTAGTTALTIISTSNAVVRVICIG
jgi:hypothetical protein